MSSQQKKSTFFGGAAILTISAILVKLIGAIYKIPLGNILSDEAMGDFNGAYNIYNFFLTISTAGLPVALSKTVSEAHTLGRGNQVNRVFKVALLTFLVLGGVGFFLLSVLAGPMSSIVLSNPKATYCVLALSPSVLCVCVMSAFRGYFQGRFNMTPTGVSQVIESFLKLAVGLSLAVLIMNMAIQPEDFRNQMAAAGAIVGVSVGSVAALFYLFVTYARQRDRAVYRDRPDSGRDIFWQLMRIAIPITLGAASTSIVTLIDSKLVMLQLQNVFIEIRGAAEGAALDSARSLYGIYSKCMSIYNLPFSMMVPLTASIIPAVSACRARRDRLGAQKITESSMRIGMLLAMPMGVGLFALGGPIISTIFPSINAEIAGPLMSMLGMAAVFVSIQLLCNSILQANGMVNLPIAVVVIGGIVKLIVNYTLVGNPDILINGAPIGTLSCFVVESVLEMLIIKRAIPAAPRFGRVLVKPAVASALMGLAAWASHGLLDRLLRGMNLFWKVNAAGETYFSWLGTAVGTFGAIGVGVVVYAVLVLALHAITRQDLELMPKGDKIAKVLRIR